MTQCYMCPAKTVSQEHVPPSCIFPESKDLPPGVNYRNNLITVPSCAEHNLRKSGDDEYLLFLLVTNWAINDVGLQHWKTKILRSISRRPSKRGIYKNLRPVLIKGVNTGIYDIDIGRINGEVEKISRGIYYHHFHKHWLFPLHVVIPSAIAIGTPEASQNNNVIQTTALLIRNLLDSENVYGENPDIFYYQYKIIDETASYVLRMVFYGGLEIATFSNIPEPVQQKPA